MAPALQIGEFSAFPFNHFVHLEIWAIGWKKSAL